MLTPSQTLQARWLAALLPHVAQSGWTRANLQRAATEAELSAGEQALAAPNGVEDLVAAFFEAALREMRGALPQAELESLRVHERVCALILAFLQALEPHRPAVRRAFGRALTPWGREAGREGLWHIADTIWLSAGDRAEDYNRYTKRALLCAILPDILLFWLRMPDTAALEAFILRRLKQAMALGKTGAGWLAPFIRGSSPMAGASRP